MLQEKEIRESALLDIARAMVVAARTAPKGKGVDNLFACIIPRDEIPALQAKMDELFIATESPVFKINGDDILKAECIVVLGARDMPWGSSCAGFADLPPAGKKSSRARAAALSQ